MLDKLNVKYERIKEILSEIKGYNISDENFLKVKEDVYNLPVNLYNFKTEEILIVLLTISFILLLLLKVLTKTKLVLFLLIIVFIGGVYVIQGINTQKKYDTLLAEGRSEIVELDNEIRVTVAMIDRLYPKKLIYIEPVDLEIGKIDKKTGEANIQFKYKEKKIEGLAKVVEIEGLQKTQVEGYYREGFNETGKVPNYIDVNIEKMKLYVPKGSSGK